MATVNKQVRSGNLITATFDNTVIGLLQSVEFSDDYRPEPASGIGNIYAQEYVPTMASYEITASTMVLYTESMYSAGIAFTNGEDALKGLVFDIQVQDQETGEVLRKYINCSYASGSIQIQKHTIVATNARFNCLRPSGTLT